MSTYTYRLSADSAEVWRLNPVGRDGRSWRAVQIATVLLRAHSQECDCVRILSHQDEVLAEGTPRDVRVIEPAPTRRECAWY